jgi:Protein of unknown function (DUF3370)
MLNFLAMPIAQVVPAPPVPQYIIEEHPVRLLPGQLDKVPVFNSNSPEVVQSEGVLLSTLAPQGRPHQNAHLNYTFSGRFDIFTHHIARPGPTDKRRLNLGILVYNAGPTPVQLEILQSLSYTTKDDAPFHVLPAYVYNPEGRYFSGPGSRLATDLLLGASEAPSRLTILPGQSQVIFNRPIPTGSARSGLMRLRSNGPLQVASVALADRPETPPNEPWAMGHITAQKFGDARPPRQLAAAAPLVRYRSPQDADWQTAINTMPLATPRDVSPTPPGSYGSLVYGRVAGVSQGTRWEGLVTDRPEVGYLSIPARGQAFSYVLNTPDSGTLGTGQVQTARLLVRYPDTAYDAHGNYATHYRLTMPLQNNTSADQVVTIKMQTPLKDQFKRNSLRFNAVPAERIFFRGTVQVTYPGAGEEPVVRSIHIVQKQGERGQALVALRLAPGVRKLVEVDLVYPPDATPPQVLTLESFDPVQAPLPPAERVIPLVEVEVLAR